VRVVACLVGVPDVFSRSRYPADSPLSMDNLQAISTLVRVVEARSFSKAAETLSMPRSCVTTTIKNLEQHLGTALLRRSTHTLSMTEAGERYYESCRTILAGTARAEDSTLIARKLGTLTWLTCASPFCLQERGEPLTMTMQSRYAVNETEACLPCGIEGLGIIQLSEFVAKPDLESGRLREVLA
jgi:DNA-binding transcriptional LysR family regulator